MTALNKAGVTFSQDQQDTIKALVETGDLLGAQKIILAEVESQVGGTAEAQKTSAKELSVAWGNLKEELGDQLIPIMDDLADVMLDKGIPAGEKFSDWLKKDGIPQIKDFAEAAGRWPKKCCPPWLTRSALCATRCKTALPYRQGSGRRVQRHAGLGQEGDRRRRACGLCCKTGFPAARARPAHYSAATGALCATRCT